MPAINPHSIVWNTDGTASVTVRSAFTGQTHTRVLRMDRDAYDTWAAGRAYIQTALPHLSPDEREFLLTGATPEEWNAAFPPPCPVCGEDEDEECARLDNDLHCPRIAARTV